MQDACAHKILLDGRFGKIEQEDLSSTCKINQDQCLARLSEMVQDRARSCFARLGKM